MWEVGSNSSIFTIHLHVHVVLCSFYCDLCRNYSEVLSEHPAYLLQEEISFESESNIWGNFSSCSGSHAIGVDHHLHWERRRLERKHARIKVLYIYICNVCMLKKIYYIYIYIMSPWALKMKNKSVGHLKARVFTIKTSKQGRFWRLTVYTYIKDVASCKAIILGSRWFSRCFLFWWILSRIWY